MTATEAAPPPGRQHQKDVMLDIIDMFDPLHPDRKRELLAFLATSAGAVEIKYPYANKWRANKPGPKRDR